MKGREQANFDMLRRGPCASREYIEGYYGLSCLGDDKSHQGFESWFPDFEAWAEKSLRPERRPSCEKDWVSRYEIEDFMQQKGLVPKRWMGAQLGMDVDSLDKLLSRLSGLQLRRRIYEAYPDLMVKSFDDDLVRNLKELKFQTFHDHNEFCERLHRELQKELEIAVTPLFCATSERLGENPKQFASDFDCFTFEPVSGRHKIWLDFRKPLYLWPDCCSKLLYVENRETLLPFLAGSYEPEDLERYTQSTVAE